jgi:hypothetical protein
MHLLSVAKVNLPRQSVLQGEAYYHIEHRYPISVSHIWHNGTVAEIPKEIAPDLNTAKSCRNRIREVVSCPKQASAKLIQSLGTPAVPPT